MKIPIW